MIPDDLILRYYREKFPESALPKYSNWRQFKFRTYTGIDPTKKKYQRLVNCRWHIVHSKINNKEDFIKEIELCTRTLGVPKDIYYTVSRWLSPETLKTKRHAKLTPMFKTKDNNFLGADFVMDFDAKNEEQVPLLKRQFELAVKILNSEGYTDLTFVRTGRGIQIHVNDWEEKTIKRKFSWPGKRENHYKQIMANAVMKLKRRGIVFDFAVSTDTRRIVRLPYSVHGTAGIVCVTTSNPNHMTFGIPKIVTFLQSGALVRKNSVSEQAIPA